MLRRFVVASLFALAGLLSARAASVMFEAESAALGTDWTVSNSPAPAYITITSNGTGSNPGTAARVATYTINFPTADTYQLYARVNVGTNTFNDDSLFYAASFGTKNPALNSDWILVNGLGTGGFTNNSDVVTGGGTLGNSVWKWINLSQFTSQSGFTVTAGNLTQTFQIGAREDGLKIDKFVFGTAGAAYTVSNLDSGTEPSTSSSTLTNTFVGPDGIALHRFNPLSGGLNLDGAQPAAGLIFSGGLLYGATLLGGAKGAGTLFSVTPDGTTFNAFRSFTNAPDAGNPQSALIAAANNFFTASSGGGSKGMGAILMANNNGALFLLENFPAVSPDNATNFGGASPGTLLAFAGATLYGTTTAGGAQANGTVFSVSTNGSTFTVLHDFAELDSNTGANADGAAPNGGVVLSGNTLYGTASAGGPGGAGVVFSLNTNGNTFTVLHSFSPLDAATATNTDGAFPLGGLVLSNGTLYGTASAGGSGGKGVIFSVTTNGANFTVLHHFSATDIFSQTNSDGASPVSELTLAGAKLYGTASTSGAHASGTVFSVATNGAQFQTIFSFAAIDPVTGTNRDGAFPTAGVLLLGTSLYGTASGGGPAGMGTVFSVPLPPTPALITSIARDPIGNVNLSFLGTPNSTNVVQSTASLSAPAWQNISTNQADAGGAWQFADTNSAAIPIQFYRSSSF